MRGARRQKNTGCCGCCHSDSSDDDADDAAPVQRRAGQIDDGIGGRWSNGGSWGGTSVGGKQRQRVYDELYDGEHGGDSNAPEPQPPRADQRDVQSSWINTRSKAKGLLRGLGSNPGSDQDPAEQAGRRRRRSAAANVQTHAKSSKQVPAPPLPDSQLRARAGSESPSPAPAHPVLALCPDSAGLGRDPAATSVPCPNSFSANFGGAHQSAIMDQHAPGAPHRETHPCAEPLCPPPCRAKPATGCGSRSRYRTQTRAQGRGGTTAVPGGGARPSSSRRRAGPGAARPASRGTLNTTAGAAAAAASTSGRTGGRGRGTRSAAAASRCGTLQHELSSQNMALITSDYGMLPEHQMALIISGCAPFRPGAAGRRSSRRTGRTRPRCASASRSWSGCR